MLKLTKSASPNPEVTLTLSVKEDTVTITLERKQASPMRLYEALCKEFSSFKKKKRKQFHKALEANQDLLKQLFKEVILLDR